MTFWLPDDHLRRTVHRGRRKWFWVLAATAWFRQCLGVNAHEAAGGSGRIEGRRRWHGATRFLQGDIDSPSEACELIDPRQLEKLVEGPIRFVPAVVDMLVSGELEAVPQLPSSDAGESDIYVPPSLVLVNKFNYGKDGAQSVVLDAASQEHGSFMVTGVAPITFDSTVNVEGVSNIFSIASSRDYVQFYIEMTRFRATPIAGRVSRREDGKPFQALILGIDGKSDEDIFVYVDRIPGVNRFNRDVAKVAKKEKTRISSEKATPQCGASEVPNETCVKRARKRYKKDKTAQATNPLKERLSEMEKRVLHLDNDRFEWLGHQGAICAAEMARAVGQGDLTETWHPGEIFDCLMEEENYSALQRRYLLDYTIVEVDAQIALSAHDRKVSELKKERDVKILECCKSNRRPRRRMRRVAAPKKQERLSRELRSAPRIDYASANSSRDTLVETPPHRSLQGVEELCNLSAFNEDRQRELEELNDDLYRALIPDAEAPPDEAFTIFDFDSEDEMDQVITSKTDAFSLEVRRVAQVDIDVKALLNKRKTVPKEVKKFIKKADFTSTPVQATSGDVEFVGLVFAREGKSKQVIWPVDYTLFVAKPPEELTRRRLVFDREGNREGKGAATSPATSRRRVEEKECVGEDLVYDSNCGAAASMAFEVSIDTILAELTTEENKIGLERAELDKLRLDSFTVAAGECLYELGADVDASELYDCVNSRKGGIVFDFVSAETALDNRQIIARVTARAKEERLNSDLDEALSSCCLDMTVPASAAQFTVSPTAGPSHNPTAVSSARPTSSPPTGIPSPGFTDAPTLGPTDMPSQAPTKGPTDEPSQAPMKGPTDVPSQAPTKGPTSGPSEEPTALPTLYPTGGPSVGPTLGPTAAPTVGPSLAPTSRPSEGPSSGPTVEPSSGPTVEPTRNPTSAPTHNPTFGPTLSPTHRPTMVPTPVPTMGPTPGPSMGPTPGPTRAPSHRPTLMPSFSPSRSPTVSPSDMPTYSPTLSPTSWPTMAPTKLCPNTVDFSTLDDGTVLTESNTISSSDVFVGGVSVSGSGSSPFSRVMIFDASTGVSPASSPLNDLVATSQGNILIVSGNPSTPQVVADSQFVIVFATPVKATSMKVIGSDNQPGTIQLQDTSFNTLSTLSIPTNGGVETISLGDVFGVSRILITFVQEFAGLDDLSFGLPC